MSGQPITLTHVQRDICAHAIVDKLAAKGCEVIAIAVSGQHVHVQVRADNQTVKRLVGIAKQYASHQLHRKLPGNIWGGGCHVTPIRSKDHQIRVFRYLQKHRAKAAIVSL